MSVTVSTAAAMAAASTAANNAAIRKQHCETFVKTFDNSKATVGQAREYSECILEMYPTKQETQHDAAILLATIVVSIVIGVGIAWYKKEDWDLFIVFPVLAFVCIWLVLGFVCLVKIAFGV